MLRFFGVWDDRAALYGDRRPYRLHYFLEDSTVELLETNERNSGRQAFPVFLRRGPLPKVCRAGLLLGRADEGCCMCLDASDGAMQDICCEGDAGFLQCTPESCAMHKLPVRTKQCSYQGR